MLFFLMIDYWPYLLYNTEMSTEDTHKEEAYYSKICMSECGGMCCAPWWGIVSFPVRKDNGLRDEKRFLQYLSKEVKARQERIKQNYVTSESPPRRLFDNPEKINVVIEDIKLQEKSLLLTVRAMFAFRCRFLGGDNSCLLHPSLLKEEENEETDLPSDIRPPHCGYMGTPSAKYGEKGFCRIIGAAKEGPETGRAIADAISLEKRSSQTYFDRGKATIEEAAEEAIGQVKAYLQKNAPGLLREEVKKPGRNDPCPCGSNKKYKKCHG